jgi:WD40 repeat protein
VDLESENFKTKVQCVTQGHHGDVWALAMNPAMPFYVTAGDDKLLKRWDIQERSGVAGKTLVLPYMVRAMVVSPDGNYIAVAFKENTNGVALPAPVWVLNFFTYEVVVKLEECQESVASVAFSPDGRYLAVCSDKVYLYEVPVTVKA